MTFKDVIFKNFTKGIRKYASFFFSGVFCVAIFFMYSTLVLLNEVMEQVDAYPMFGLFVVTCFIVAVFSIFFINYSHQNFISKKKKSLQYIWSWEWMKEQLLKCLELRPQLLQVAQLLPGW